MGNLILEHQAFLKITIAICFSVLLSAGIFNYLIDPYNIFQAISIPGINTSKTGASDRIAFSKSYMVKSNKPKTLIIGTSKFDIGLNPESEYIPDKIKPVFNFSVPGASLYDQFRYLQHASTINTPELVIMSLEFESFLELASKKEKYPPQRKNYEHRLIINYDGSPNKDQFLQKIKDYSASLLSNTAIFDSFNTIMSGDTIWLNQNGFSSGSIRFGSEVRNKGHFSVFRDVIQKQANLIQNRQVSDSAVAFKALEDILRFCVDQNINIIFVIPPYHAFQYKLWDSIGLWSDFELWKQLLVKKMDNFKNKRGISIILWDYAVYNQKSTESVPPPSDETSMNWYWEPIHFKENFGDIIIKETVLGDLQSTEKSGTIISSDNICQHLSTERTLKSRYHKNRNTQISIFQKMVPSRFNTPDKIRYIDKTNIICTN